MKAIISIVAVVILTFGAYHYISQTPVTKGHFDSRVDTLQDIVKDLQAKVKLLYANSDSIKYDVRAIKNDVNTLKKGQQVIYSEVAKPSDTRSFLEKILDLP